MGVGRGGCLFGTRPQSHRLEVADSAYKLEMVRSPNATPFPPTLLPPRRIYASAFKAAHSTCARSPRIYTCASVLITANDAGFVAADGYRRGEALRHFLMLASRLDRFASRSTVFFFLPLYIRCLHNT